ncbi:Myosin-J heavy chain [Bienertia sinuspersici]
MSLLTSPLPATRTWSYQLQFNFKFRKSQTPLMFVKARNSILSNHRRNHLRVQCVAQDEVKSDNDSEKGRSGDSWNNLNNSSVDSALSDWFGNSDDSGKKNGIAGILGAGLAGVLLVAGITSAAMSIGKRNSSRSIPEMKPLTEHQEVLLDYEEEVHKEEENIDDGQFNVQDENNLESNTGIESDLSSSLGPTAFVSERALVDDTNVESLSGGEKSTSIGLDASAQENFQTVNTLSDINSPDTNSTSLELPQIESINGSYVSSTSVETQSTSTVDNAEDGVGLLSTNVQQETFAANETDSSNTALESSSTNLQNAALETDNVLISDVQVADTVANEDNEVQKPLQFSGESNVIPVGDTGASATLDEQDRGIDAVSDRNGFESQSLRNVYSSRGIPAPSLLSAALQVPAGKVLVPAVTDQTQSQALTALQVLKVIETDAQPGDLCTRREYVRWLVSASSALSRNLISKVYPAMYIENVTELAFDDITPEDPDFTSIQGLAEAGLISSKLSRRDMLSSPDEDIGTIYFHPDSPLSRQDLVTWKMTLEKRQLPEADKKALHQLSGFIDIDRIDPDACPALLADLSAAEQGIVALAFGYTRLFQPDKPVTKGQAAIALATGEAADVVSEELARIEAESIADKAVATHNALVEEVEKDINANFEKELLMEREKVDAVQKMAEEAQEEVERLRAEREEKNIALMKERAAIESEMEVLSRMRNELEEQLQSVMGNKAEVLYEKERIEKLKKETEEENQAIVRLQYELEVERKALSMARTWAEDEAKRVQDYAKALEEARDRWERKGLKVMVGEDLREEASADTTWTNVGKRLSAEETVERADNLTDKLKAMADEVSGKSKEIINMIILKIQSLISAIKEWISEAGKRTTEFGDVAVAKVGGSVQELQQNAAGFGASVKEGATRVVGDCREGVEKLTQRFKT